MTERKPPPSKASSNGGQKGVLNAEWEEALIRGQNLHLDQPDADEHPGGAGGLDADLAVVHLLRHARQPETLDAAELDQLWGDIEAQVAATGEEGLWSRLVARLGPNKWLLWATPITAAAVVTLIVIVPRNADVGVGSGFGDAVAVSSTDDKPAKSESLTSGAPAAAAPARAREAKEAVASAEAEEAESAGDESRAAGRSGAAAESERMFATLAPNARGELIGAVEMSRREIRNELIATGKRAGQGGGR